MAVIVKSGVVFKILNDQLMRLYMALRDISVALGVDMVITSANDGVHKPDGFHYKDLAWDARTKHLDSDQIESVVEMLKMFLGEDYDIVLEKDHIHVEYDPHPTGINGDQ